MSKIFRMACLGILCIVAAHHCYGICDKPEIQISFTTLKSDLDWILESARVPTIVNIEYTDDAGLHLSVVPRPHGQGLCIKFEETLDIKLANGTMVQKSDAVYADGSLGLPLSQDTLAHIIINTDVRVKPAHFTISYTSMTELTKNLQNEAKDLKTTKLFTSTSFLWPQFSIGSLNTPMKFSPEDEYFLLKKPLKGISLHEGKKIEKLFEKWHKKFISVHSSSSNLSSDGVSPYGSKRQPDVFFDVWYDPKGQRYGSSSGPLSGVDAVRIYEGDEWKHEMRKKISAVETHVTGRRGEHIRRKVLAQDLDIAYRRLSSEDPVYDNVIIDYAEEIILDVRPGVDGHHRYVTATGISVNARGDKPNNVRAYYDLENLDYSNPVVTNVKFVPENGERTSFIKYIDWGTFETHMEAVWTAMQRGCTQKRVYHFSIFYGDEIHVRYNCDKKSLAVIGTLWVLTDIPKTSVRGDILKAAVSKCKDVLYLPVGSLESPCMCCGIRPIAIQQQPEKFWLNSKPVSVNAEVFKNELEILSKILSKKGKSDGRTLTVGTVFLDDTVLFLMKLGTTNNFEIRGNLIHKTASGYEHHTKLGFNGFEFSTPGGISVAVTDVWTSGRYRVSVSDSINENIITSDYLTIKKLIVYLRTILSEALYRCISKRNSLRFKLVRHRKFALDGFCDCSKRVVFLEGEFRTLLLNEMDGNAEARSTRLINNLIYVENGQLLIPGGDSFHDLYAISVPELTNNYKATRKEFGGSVDIKLKGRDNNEIGRQFDKLDAIQCILSDSTTPAPAKACHGRGLGVREVAVDTPPWPCPISDQHAEGTTSSSPPPATSPSDK